MQIDTPLFTIDATLHRRIAVGTHSPGDANSQIFHVFAINTADRVKHAGFMLKRLTSGNDTHGKCAAKRVKKTLYLNPIDVVAKHDKEPGVPSIK